MKSPSSSEDEDNDGYLISKALDSVTKSKHSNVIKSLNRTGESFNNRKSSKKDYDTSSKGSNSNRKR